MARESSRMARTDRRGSEAVLGSGFVELHVLGTVEAVHVRPDGTPHPIDIGGRRQRTVLALLLARHGTPVHIDTLIDDLWGDEPPATARHAIHVYLSELRKQLPGLIESTPHGYECAVDTNVLDSLRFDSIVGAADAIVAHDPTAALESYLEGESLWRGDPYQGVEDRDPVTSEARRLAELRLTALETRFRIQLDLGRHIGLIAELDATCDRYPFREQFRALHMLALYRSGRQAEALRAFQRTRAFLGGELGIEPSPSLRGLEEQILVHDPSLGRASDVIDDHNPYPGLPPFTEEDAANFHGRDHLVEALEEAVTRGGVVGLVGPSGSGKTSVVRAGLIPRVRGERRVAYTTVGSDPFASLERALRLNTPHPELRSTTDATLAQVANGGGPLLVVVDQFEELFADVVADHVRRRFLDELLQLGAMPDTAVLVSLRADFYDRPLAYPAFGEALAAGQITVMPLAPEELEEAAVLPARRMGVTFEPGVLGALMSDLAGQPSALPLFAHTMSELYQRRSGNRLTIEAYRDLGGVRRALAQRAEAQYTGLDPAQQTAARRLFLRLVRLTDQGPARRRVPAAEVDDIGTDLVDMQAAIEAFTRHRLLTLDRDPVLGSPIIDLAHEALLTEWGRLTEWVGAAHDDIQTLSALDNAVTEWVNQSEDPAYLATGSRVDRYQALGDTVGLTSRQRRFVAASAQRGRDTEATLEADRRERARMRRRLRMMGTGFGLAALAVTGVAATRWVPDLVAGPPHILVVMPEDRPPEIDIPIAIAEGAELDIDVERHFYDAYDETDFERVIEAETPDYVFIDQTTVGLAYVERAVADNPETRFTVVAPRWGPPPGIEVNVFASEQAGFLAGAAAASATETGVVGLLGGFYPDETDRWRAGFESGVAAVNRRVEILATDTLHMSEQRAVRALFELDADVVLVEEPTWVIGSARIAANVTQQTGIHRWVIGGVSDAHPRIPEDLATHFLTSAITDVAAVYVDRMLEYGKGEWRAGTTVLGIADGYIRLGEGGLDDASRRLILELADAIAAGEIGVPTVPRLPLTRLALDGDTAENDERDVRRPTSSEAIPPDSPRLDFLVTTLCSSNSCQLDPMFVDDQGRTSDTLRAGDPFHVRHGFVDTDAAPLLPVFDIELIITRDRGPALPIGQWELGESTIYRSEFGLMEDTDRCGPDYFTQTETLPCEMFVIDFPDGLPAGTYLVSLNWLAPCSEWDELGFDRPCDDPDIVVAGFQSDAFIRVYSEANPRWLPIDEGIDIPLPEDLFD